MEWREREVGKRWDGWGRNGVRFYGFEARGEEERPWKGKKIGNGVNLLMAEAGTG